MAYRHSTQYCFTEREDGKNIGSGQVDDALSRLAQPLASLQKRAWNEVNPLLALPARQDDLAAIETLAEKIRSRFGSLVVAGAGGSGLSGRVLTATRRLSELKLPVYFLDNIDPTAIDNVLHRCRGQNPCFLLISKSGGTVETLAHAQVLLAHAGTLEGKASERFFVITLPGDNPLNSLARAQGIATLDHDTDIGGRFSVLTNVGLLPAAVAGLDIRALRRGAKIVVDAMDNAALPTACAPALGAAMQYAACEGGRNISVLLPYCERLSGLNRWYRQSWSESLGKDGKGSTPAPALGSTDQHSQLQLYLDDPPDKLFTVITLKHGGSGQRLAIGDMMGKTTGDIMAAEQKATVETLIRNHCPVRLIELDTLAEEQVGALLMHFTLEIIFMSRLLDVNPCDQPAVEESKQLARDYLAGRA